jgi:RNA polymerase sigma factor (sigma-70 family)
MAADVNVRPVAPPPSLVAVLEEQWMPLVRLATLLTGDADAARDVVQDCLEGVLRLRPDLDDTAHLVAYLRKAVINRARSRLRRQRTVNRYLMGLTKPRDVPSAERELLAAERHREVLRNVDLLPARQREVIVLRYYCELSEAETAATLGVSLGTVKAAAHRALNTLRRRMKDTNDEH